MHNRASAAARERWGVLVRLLRGDLDVLVGEFLERIQEVPSYSREMVPEEQLAEDAAASFDYLLRRIGGLSLPPKLREIGLKVGRDRAHRGVPLDDLLTAVRLDFRVLWHALQARCEVDDMELLVARAEDVWSVVEEYTTTIQTSYLEHTAALARERRRERSAVVGGLLAQRQPDPAQVNRVAVALDVDADAVFLVAASRTGDDAPLRGVADQLAAAGRRVHLQDTGPHSLLLLRWLGSEHSSAHTLLSAARCGIGPLAAGLGRVPDSARVAQEIVDVLPPEATGPHELRDAWLWLVGDRLGELASDLVAEALGGLDSARSNERDRLVETVRSYGACGSVLQTAAGLYCHRNTVVHRLRRFKELTGTDPTVPRHAALALLALEWASEGTIGTVGDG
jgi:hypothetical protein